MKMSVRVACFAMLSAVCFRPAAAQLTIGTTPGTDVILESTGNYASWLGQNFTATAPYLTSVSFWFHDGQTLEGAEDFFSEFWLGAATDYWPDQSLYIESIKHRSYGRYDVAFDPIAVTPGDTYSFSVFTNNCGPEPICGAPIGDEYFAPMLETTTTDAYSGGYAFDRNGALYDRDVRFQATFSNTASVPEPPLTLLVLSGCLALLAVRFLRADQAPTGVIDRSSGMSPVSLSVK